AVSDVGSWLSTPSNVNSLTNLAATYFKTQASAANANAQTAVLQTQVARANAGLAPAPITYNSAGQPVYVPGASQVVPAGTVPTGYTATGAPIYNVTPNTLASLGPNFLQQYGIWLLLGGAALVAAMIFMRK
ncbi:MAG: hypothetical protein ACREAC_07285, partial [Blastocatellia bacterium]